MEIEAVELRRIGLPLVEPFRTAGGEVTARDLLLVRVRCDGRDGWGECVAMPAPTYTSEYVDAAEEVLRAHLAPRLLAAAPRAATDVAQALSAVQGHRMAKAALETAVLDAELRAAGQPLSAFLGGTRTDVDAGVSVGMASSPAELVDTVERRVGEGYRRVKLKIAPGWDFEPTRAVRERWPDLALQVDANGSYRLDDAPRLAALDPFGLLLVEQPLPATDLVGHAALARRITTPICLDESIRCADDVRSVLALGAAAVINVKPGRVGGLLEAQRIHDLCLEAGVPLWCGGMLESGLGRAANAALASLPGFTLPGDLPAGGRWFTQDITAPLALSDGRLPVPTGPGLGVEPEMAQLDSLTTSAQLVRR